MKLIEESHEFLYPSSLKTKRNPSSHKLNIKTDGAFSIDYGLDLLGVTRLVSWAESLYKLQPALKGWSDEGAPAESPMPKSISFLLKGKNSIVDGVMIAYLFVVGWVGIYKEK